MKESKKTESTLVARQISICNKYIAQFNDARRFVGDRTAYSQVLTALRALKDWPYCSGEQRERYTKDLEGAVDEGHLEILRRTEE